MADAQMSQNVTSELHQQSNRPPQEAPANMRHTYSILETGEVVAIGVSRIGSGKSAQVDPYVWMDKGRRWGLAEQEYGPDIAQQLIDGMERYEQVLRKDPKRAALLRQRSDNTVDGHPNAEEAPAEVAGKAQAAGALGGAPVVEDPTDTPNVLGSTGVAQ